MANRRRETQSLLGGVARHHLEENYDSDESLTPRCSVRTALLVSAGVVIGYNATSIIQRSLSPSSSASVARFHAVRDALGLEVTWSSAGAAEVGRLITGGTSAVARPHVPSKGAIIPGQGSSVGGVAASTPSGWPSSDTGPFDLDSKEGLRRAVRARASRSGSELVLFTSDVFGLSSAANLALQLKRLGIFHHLVLAEARRTCEIGQARWPWMGCGWSVGLPGFVQRYGDTPKVRLWGLWSAKWLTIARLAELRANVLGLDTDVILLTDPYPILHALPMRRFHMVVPPEGSRVNLGFLYVRGSAMAGGGGASSVLWDLVRRLRLFSEDYTLCGSHSTAPKMLGLWDQGVFTDALASAQTRRLVYPFTFLESKLADVWPAIGWPERNESGALPEWRDISSLHRIQWHVAKHDVWARDAKDSVPDDSLRRPDGYLLHHSHPQAAAWRAQRGFQWSVLHPLDPLIHLSNQRPGSVSPGWMNASCLPAVFTANSVAAAAAFRRGALLKADDAIASIGKHGGEMLLGAPDWLYCTTGRWMITAGWPALRPSRPCSVLHLVESRAMFGWTEMDKMNRPYVQRAYGMLHPESIFPAEPSLPTRFVRLSRRSLAATAASTGVGGVITALRILALTAAVTNRTFVTPTVPCASRWLIRHEMTLAGIADDYVLQLPGDTPGSIICHLSPGGRGCATFDVALPAWHAVGPEQVPAERIVLQIEAPGEMPVAQVSAGAGPAKVDVAIGHLRAEAARLSNAEMIEVEPSSLAPLRWEMPLVGLEVDGGSSLTSDELHRLRLLRGRCPGFFSKVAESAGNYHRKRLRSHPKPGRLTPPRVSEDEVVWAAQIQGTPGAMGAS